MIHNIREAFTEILEDSDWMDDATKAVAKEKVSVIVFLCHDAESSLSSYPPATYILSCKTREATPSIYFVGNFFYIHNT